MGSLFNIKSHFILLFVAFFGFMAIAQTAEAKRFGGGKSFGYQKQVAPKSFNKQQDKKQTPPAGQQAGAAGAAGTAAAGTAARSGASKWLGPLAGLAAGGLLAAMIFGDGFDGIQLFDILLFALIAFILFKVFTSMARKNAAYQQANDYSANPRSEYENQNAYQRTSQQPAETSSVQHKAAAQPYNPDQQGSIFGADLDNGMGQGASQQAEYYDEVPTWFNAEQFVEGAKQHFVSLQKAWDKVDLQEIESYCTSELFKALQAELAGANPGDNHTVVDELDAELATMALDGDYLVVSVRFTGFIQEDAVGAHAFNEIWHIRRLANDEGNWLVAGIQQAS